MPITPFHFGAGVLAKGVFPRSVSLLAFVTSQVVIDCETAYFMLIRHEWPFHRWAHTFLVGSLVGLAAGLAAGGVATLWQRRYADERTLPDLREAAFVPAALGGIFGGLSHALLDGIMHDDVRPFRPFSDANPLLGLVSLPVLHLALVVAGGVGLVFLALAAKRLGWTHPRMAAGGRGKAS